MLAGGSGPSDAAAGPGTASEAACLRAWLLLLTLMEDDDDTVRHTLNFLLRCPSLDLPLTLLLLIVRPPLLFKTYFFNAFFLLFSFLSASIMSSPPAAAAVLFVVLLSYPLLSDSFPRLLFLLFVCVSSLLLISLLLLRFVRPRVVKICSNSFLLGRQGCIPAHAQLGSQTPPIDDPCFARSATGLCLLQPASVFMLSVLFCNNILYIAIIVMNNL